MSKKILFIVAYEGYQQVEYNIPKQVLINTGNIVITGSTKRGSAIAKDGSTTEVEVLLEDIKVHDYDGIFFIGGPGALDDLDNEKSYSIARNANKANMPFGAICIATRILAKSGTLTGREATGWNGDGELAAIFKKYDVEYIKKPVVIDENIITAVGPDAAQDFGKAITQVISQ